ncbi:MAG TPA: hypothetical protein ENK57_26195 [Polyangiaceae bacterium]|nr:hypothetical protein [Polyangiaceae bacterium]
MMDTKHIEEPQLERRRRQLRQTVDLPLPFRRGAEDITPPQQEVTVQTADHPPTDERRAI